MLLTRNILDELTNQACEEAGAAKKKKSSTSDEVHSFTSEDIQAGITKLRELVLTAAQLGEWEVTYSIVGANEEYYAALSQAFKNATHNLMVILCSGREPYIVVSWHKSNEV